MLSGVAWSLEAGTFVQSVWGGEVNERRAGTHREDGDDNKGQVREAPRAQAEAVDALEHLREGLKPIYVG